MSDRDGRRSGSDDGLTIVELLIALLIVMVAFAALAATLISSFAAIRNNEDRVTATALANELIEEMSNTDWDLVGIRESEVPVDGAGDPLQSVDGEPIVVLDDGVDAAPQTEGPIDRDGRDYFVERMVTWDEVATEAVLKRMVVTVTWDDGDRSIRTEGLRAPDPDDLAALEIEAFDIGELIAGTFEPQMNLDADLENVGVITARVRVGTGSASVVLRYAAREDAEPVAYKTFPGVDPGKVDEYDTTISEGAHRFRHGPVSFEVEATGVDGQKATAVQVMRFYQDLLIQPVTALDAGGGTEITSLSVCSDGTLAEAVTVDAEVWGLTNAEATQDGALTLTWTAHQGGTQVFDQPAIPFEFRPVGSTPAGGEYQVDLKVGEAIFPAGAAGDDVVAGDEQIRFRVSAQRDVVDENDALIADFTDSDARASGPYAVTEVACP